MKHLIIILMLVLPGISGFSQVTKYYTVSSALRIYDERYQRWDEWSDWNDVRILITLDMKKGLQIYSKEYQQFDLITQGEESEDYDKTILTFTAIDHEGLRCWIKVYVYKEDGTRQIHILWSNVQVIYQLEE